MWLIYKHINKINGKIYVGQTKFTMNKRWNEEVNTAFNSNQHSKYYFSNAIRKYGKDNWLHEIIEENIESQELSDIREIYWISEFKSNQKEFGYNSTSGGGSMRITQEVKDKISKNRKGKGTGPKTIKHTENIRKSRIGNKHSEETKLKMSDKSCKNKTWKLVDGKRVWSDK